MFTKSVELFKLFGFSVRVDASWLLIAILVVWSLATGFFPHFYPELTRATCWWMGVGGAIGLFGSIVFHELSHSLVARQRGIQMRGITLFVFGGVAQMDDEPPDAAAEFLMAIAGPLASVVVAGVSFALWQVSHALSWPVPVGALLWYLAFLNSVLVAFNLVPAFPLDGGRVFRSLLWWLTDNLKAATRVTSLMGSGFGIFLVGVGVFAFILGDFISGIWYFLLGLFLRAAAAGSYQRLLVRQVLEGEPIRRFVQPEVQTVSPSTNIQHLVDNYIYRHHFKMFPVVKDGRLVGCVKTQNLKGVPRDEWHSRQVAEITEPCSDQNTIEPEADALKALAKMSRSDGNSRLMVVKEGQLEGIISLKDMMRLISLKIELEQGETGIAGPPG